MIARCVQREEDAHRHLQQRLPGAGRLRGGRRAVRLHQARPGQHAHRRGGNDRPGGDHADHRREGPAALPDADRDHRGPGHDRVRGLADHEEGLRRPRHHRASRCWPTASSGSCPAGSTSPRSATSGGSARAATPRPARRVEKFLREVLNTEKFPLTVMDRPDRVGDHEDRRELLPRHDPGVPQRMEPVRRAQRRGPDQGHQGHQDAAHAQQHHLPRPGHRRLLPAQGRRAGLLGLQAHPRLRGRRPGVQDQPHGRRHQRHPRPARGRAHPRRPAQHGPLHRRRRRAASAAPATARTWATRATAARRWSSASSPRWAPRCASTTPTSTTGTSWRTRTTIPPPGHSWSRFFRNQDGPEEHPRAAGPGRRAEGRRGRDPGRAARAVPGARSRTRSSQWAGEPLAVIDCFGILSRRRDPPLLRARLRGQGPRPRPHPADQGAGAGQIKVGGALRDPASNFGSPDLPDFW